MIEPEIEWLIRRFGLPPETAAHASALLDAEADGSTAVAVPADARWGFAADAGVGAPLVLVPSESGSFLQSRRMFRAEKSIASRLVAMAAVTDPAPGADRIIAELFPGAAGSDLQVAAARVAAGRRLAIITGGPGTGKTYALARILALFLECGLPPGAIRLAAPTGKAADRMKAAVTASLAGLPSGFAALRPHLAAVAESSATLHKLLGYNPGTASVQFGRSRRLPCAALIVDECSMLDTALWAATLDALPDNARLVVVGDPNQLESVGQGAVFAEIAREAARDGSPLAPCHVHLRVAHRFKDRPDLAALALALEARDGVAVADILRSNRACGRGEGVAWIETAAGAPLAPESYPAPVLEALRAIATAPDPELALAALTRACILTAQRNFFIGARATSEALDAHFARLPDAINRPIIVDANDPETGLRNGQTGIVHAPPGGIRRAWFPAADGAPKAFALARVPDHSPAWAITVHRSQGSEYDDVLVILPREDSPLATRELLYTAVSRARRNVFIAGDLDAAIAAATNASGRVTLLAHHLRPH